MNSAFNIYREYKGKLICLHPSHAEFTIINSSSSTDSLIGIYGFTHKNTVYFELVRQGQISMKEEHICKF